MTIAQEHVLAEDPRPAATTRAQSRGLAGNLRLAEIPSLSGLRAFASVTVVLCHVVSPSVPGPYAVTLFFALSGFLITTLLCGEMAATGTVDIRAFCIRRARRLLPAYYVWLAAVVLLLTDRITPEIGAAALYLSDYFNAWIKQGPISHTWSLSVEEHFYLLWPIVLLTWSRSKGFVPVSRPRSSWSRRPDLLLRRHTRCTSSTRSKPKSMRCCLAVFWGSGPAMEAFCRLS